MGLEPAVSLRELVSKVTEQRYCLNNVLMATKLKKLRNGRSLIEQTNRNLSEMAKKTTQPASPDVATVASKFSRSPPWNLKS